MSKRHSTKELIGKRFGRLVVLERLVAKRAHDRYVTLLRCKCDCGGEKVVYAGNILGGNTQSCGCYQRERTSKANTRRTKHGHTAKGWPSKAYQCWTRMKNRCYNPNVDSFPNYGGRGVKVCERWLNSFEAFFADMGEPPLGMSLDRKENDKGYSKENCRWATPKEQARNRRNNRLITLSGETKCLSAWAAEHGISVTTLWGRLKKMSLEEALTAPKH